MDRYNRDMRYSKLRFRNLKRKKDFKPNLTFGDNNKHVEIMPSDNKIYMNVK